MAGGGQGEVLLRVALERCKEAATHRAEALEAEVQATQEREEALRQKLIACLGGSDLLWECEEKLMKAGGEATAAANRVAALEEQLREREAYLEKVEKAHLEKLAQVATLKGVSEAEKERADNLDRRLQRALGEIDRAGRRCTALEAERIRVASEADTLRRRTGVEILRREAAAAKEKADGLERELQKAAWDLDAAGRTANTAMADEAKARREVQELRRKNDELTQRVGRLEDRLKEGEGPRKGPERVREGS